MSVALAHYEAPDSKGSIPAPVSRIFFFFHMNLAFTLTDDSLKMRPFSFGSS